MSCNADASKGYATNGYTLISSHNAIRPKITEYTTTSSMHYRRSSQLQAAIRIAHTSGHSDRSPDEGEPSQRIARQSTVKDPEMPGWKVPVHSYLTPSEHLRQLYRL